MENIFKQAWSFTDHDDRIILSVKDEDDGPQVIITINTGVHQASASIPPRMAKEIVTKIDDLIFEINKIRHQKEGK